MSGRRLSVGDAVAVAALLAFAFGWMAGGMTIARGGLNLDGEHASNAALFWMVVWLAPPCYCLSIVRKLALSPPPPSTEENHP